MGVYIKEGEKERVVMMRSPNPFSGWGIYYGGNEAQGLMPKAIYSQFHSA